CHGAARRRDNWVGQHFDMDWRKVPLAEKNRLGLNDLRDPQRRTEKCLSCHVGNKAEGKFISHERYAAGQPPLPAVEGTAFTHNQPPHAYLPGENAYFRTLKPDDCLKQFHYRPGEAAMTRLVVVGAVTTLRETARLLAEEARECLKAAGNDPTAARL